MNASACVPSLEQLNQEEVQRVLPAIIYLGLLIFTGTVGNLVVIFVYTTRYGPSNTKYFILCLGFLDLFTCCIVLPLEIATMTTQLNFQLVWLCKVSRFCNSVSTLSSAAVLMAISIDRYRKMCRPFGWQIARKYSGLLCVICIVAAMLMSWPTLFIYGRKSVTISQYNMTGTECSTDDAMQDTVFPLVSSIVLLGCFLIGTSIICIMYCCIGSALHEHAKRMPKDFRATSRRSQRQTSSICVVTESDVFVEINQTATETISKHSNEHTNGSNNNEIELQQFDEITVDEDDEKTKKSVNIKSSDETLEQNHRLYRRRTDHNTTDPETNGEVTSGNHNHCDVKKGPELTSNESYLRTSSHNTSLSGKLQSQKSHTALNQSKNIRKTSILMLIISVTFIVGYLPHLMLMLVREVNADFVEELSDAGRAAYKFFLRSYFLNCAMNPVIYCIYGTHFRATCKQLLVSIFSRSKREGKA